MSKLKDIRVFFANGMNNDTKGALDSGKLIYDVLGGGIEVGVIHNETEGIFSLKDKDGNGITDIDEYLNPVSMKDVWVSEIYKALDQFSLEDGKERYIINHSAGNSDSNKATSVLKDEGVKLNNKINIISVGSPIKEEELRENYNEVGINFNSAYNDPNDPVTNIKWEATKIIGKGLLALGGTALAEYGMYKGYQYISGLASNFSFSLPSLPNVDPSIFNTGTILDPIGKVAAGVAAGVAPLIVGGYITYKEVIDAKNRMELTNHPISSYISNNYGNIRTDLGNLGEKIRGKE